MKEEPTPQTKMSLEEFRRFCDDFDANITDTIKGRFEIRCVECGSDKVHLLYDGKELAQGSEYTGVWTIQETSLLFKCQDCGNAVSIKED